MIAACGSGIATVALGAPGVIYVPRRRPRLLVGVRMDVAAFVGVAPRGPACELADPHAWAFTDGVVRPGRCRWRWRAGTTTSSTSAPSRARACCPTRWPPSSSRAAGAPGWSGSCTTRRHHRRAWSCPAVPATLRRPLRPPPAGSITARNEGTWGNRLAITLASPTLPLLATEPSMLVLAVPRSRPGTGCGCAPDGSGLLRSVVAVTRGAAGAAGRDRVAQLDGPAGAAADRVDGVLDVIDHDPLRTRREHFDGLGPAGRAPELAGRRAGERSSLVELAGSAPRDRAQRHHPGPADRHAGGTGRHRPRPDRAGRHVRRWLEGDDAATDGLDVLARIPRWPAWRWPTSTRPPRCPSPSRCSIPPPWPGRPSRSASSAARRRPPPPPGSTGLGLDPTDASELG